VIRIRGLAVADQRAADLAQVLTHRPVAAPENSGDLAASMGRAGRGTILGEDAGPAQRKPACAARMAGASGEAT
jgi:hypothetical protein